MQTGDKARRLRIYISSTDKHKHSPLYEVIVYSARSSGITGVTVFKGIMGYGSSSEIYTNKIWEITEKLPLIVEMIDEPEKIDTFIQSIMPLFDEAGKGLIITAEDTDIILLKSGKKK